MHSQVSNIPALLDERGFIVDPEVWSRDLALAIAAELGVSELTAQHWEIVDSLRGRYYATGNLPVQHTLCRELDMEDHCIVELFHGLIQAWKIAGLPDPGEEARSYMQDMSEPPAQGRASQAPIKD
jgi:tRNA 2-thiouridine synthesizing protein E